MRTSASRLLAIGFMLVLSMLAMAALDRIFPMLRSQMATNLTKDGLLAVFPGMNTNDMVGVVGLPLHVEDDAWIYAEPGVFGQGLEVYVIVESDQVRSVNVENHDLGVYWWREKERKPTITDAVLLNRLPGQRSTH